MARPRKNEEKLATAGLAIRVTEDFRNRVRDQAAKKGIAITDYIVSAIEAQMATETGKRKAA
jgi:predicted DNA binding CopG/RHH family protein